MANVTDKNKNDYNTQTPVSQRKGDLQRSIREKDRMSGIKAMPGGAVSGSYKYGQPIGPMNRGYVPGGRGIVASMSVLKAPTRNAPKATVTGKTGKKITPAAAPVQQAAPKAKAATSKATEITIPGGGLKTGKASKTMTTSRGGGLGVSTGKTTGSSATRAGTGGKTTTSASQRASNNAFNKGGVAGPRGSRM